MAKAQPPQLKMFMNKKLSLKMNGGGYFIGILRGFDSFMNLVVDETIQEWEDGSRNYIGKIVNGNILVALIKVVPGCNIIMLEVLDTVG